MTIVRQIRYEENLLSALAAPTIQLGVPCPAGMIGGWPATRQAGDVGRRENSRSSSRACDGRLEDCLITLPSRRSRRACRSMFATLIATAVQETTQQRRAEVERIALALRSRDDAKRAGAYHPTENVHAESQ